MSAVAEAVATPPVAARAERALADSGLAWLAAFAAAALGAGLGRAVTTSYLPLLLDEIKDAPGLIGTAMLVNAAAGFVVPLVIGLWSDRRGRRMPFVVGGSLVAAGGAAAVALGSGSSYLLLAASGAVVYVGLNAVTTAHRALVPESFAADGRARATSAQELALLVGSLAGVVAGGALTGLATWAPFAFAAVAMPLLALPTAARVREGGSRVAVSRERRPAGYYLRAAARPGVGAFLVAQILWVLGYAALPAFFILFADRELGLAPTVAALWLGGFGLVTGAAVAAAGRVGDPARHKPLLQLGVALLGAGLLAVYFAQSLLTVGVGLVAAATGFGLVSTLGFPLFSALIPAGEAGGYTALYFSVRAISSAVALPVVGWAIAATDSYRVLFLLGGTVTLAALAPLARIPAPTRIGIAAPFRLPSRRWWLRGAAALAGVFATIAAAGQLVMTTSLSRLDEGAFRLVNELGYGPDLLWDALNPHTRNYVLLNLVAFAAAAVTRPRLLPHVAALLTLSWLLAWGLLEGVYALYDRPRPAEVIDPSAIVLERSWTWAQLESFPSGHMAVTAALAGAIGLAFPRLRPLLWAYVAAVAFTRVLFGAHFPADVIVGIALGYASARMAHSFLYEMTAQSTRSESRTGRNELASPS
jgi:membrane-associated phospholipid phosphatase